VPLSKGLDTFTPLSKFLDTFTDADAALEDAEQHFTCEYSAGVNSCCKRQVKISSW